MQIWVDADACPVVVKEILFRAADRTGVQLTLVANQPLSTPPSPNIKALQVPRGFDVADNEIAARVAAGDGVELIADRWAGARRVVGVRCPARRLLGGGDGGMRLRILPTGPAVDRSHDRGAAETNEPPHRPPRDRPPRDRMCPEPVGQRRHLLCAAGYKNGFVLKRAGF